MGVDIKTLAASLGVSASTVSRALNGYTDINAQTRERIIQRAKELDYRPNLGARRLVKGRADAVGLVYPLDTDYLGNPKFLSMIAAFSDRLETAGVDLLLAAAHSKTELLTYDRLVRGRRVDGVLVANTLVNDPRIDLLKQLNIPFVGYGRSGERNDFAWFDFDNQAGTRIAVTRLAALGHRRIAYIHTPLTYNFAAQRYAGYQEGMRAAGLTIEPQSVLDGNMERRAGYAAAQSLLALGSRPSAVIVDNSVCGVGVIHALLNAGVALGKDMSVVVDGGIPQDTLLHTLDIAAILQPTPTHTGQAMADMLLHLIQGETSLAQPHVLVQPTFIEGDSIGPAPGHTASTALRAPSI
jgi:LacI family transcriptional regulator